MRLLNDLQKLSHKLTSGNDWGQIALLSFGGSEYEIKVKYNRHHQSFNDVGMPVSALNATIETHVFELENAGVPFINTHGKIDLVGAIIVIEDTVAFRKYEVRSTIPDEGIGLIVLNLELKDNNFIP